MTDAAKTNVTPASGPRHRAAPVAVGPRRQRMSRNQRIRADRVRRRSRSTRLLLVGLVAVLTAGLVVFGPQLWSGLFKPGYDYSGDGRRDLVFEVHRGDTTAVIAERLLKLQVVATTTAFLEAADGNDKITMIQPGFYRTRTELPAATVVQNLTDPKNRVGWLTIPEGSQLDDVADIKTGKVTPGIFSMIAEASCVTLNGEKSCLDDEDLRAIADSTAPAALGVPQWAWERVDAMGRTHRRLEGLIAAGTWNVNPQGSAEEALAGLIRASAQHYANSGLIATAQSLHMTPYDVVVVSSLVQKEALPHDFVKVARVIYNRLAQPQRLEFDSTVNYPLDRREVATTDADRTHKTPWNTYADDGLPATAICSPGPEALLAAEHPEPGDWLYFVTIDEEGTTLFTHDYQQHLTNIELATGSGFLRSARTPIR